MTAYSPLLKRGVFARTVLRTPNGLELIGFLKVVDRVSQGLATADDLLSATSGIYQFQQTSPIDVGTVPGDSLTVINTVSQMVKVGEVLKVVTITESVIPIVNRLLGRKLTLVTNTVRYRVNG